jgi:DNA primase
MVDRQDLNPPLTNPLSLDPTHPYLSERGLSAEILGLFGVGYCDHGPMRGRICIPIHDAKANLVAYASRWASDTIPAGIPRYLLPTAFRKRHVLFNLHRIEHSNHVVLVEGYWSVLRLHCLGFPVAGLMGSEISLEQIALLVERNLRFITLLMDGDRAGRGGRQKITPLLAERFCVFAPLLPNGEKPDSVSESYLAALKTVY